MWTLKSNQYDDLDGAAERILFDDDHPLPQRPKTLSQHHPFSSPQ